jgi:hypothetical protein
MGGKDRDRCCAIMSTITIQLNYPICTHNPKTTHEVEILNGTPV